MPQPLLCLWLAGLRALAVLWVIAFHVAWADSLYGINLSNTDVPYVDLVGCIAAAA